MPRINLLPWRETLKKEREKRFGIITGISLAFTGLVVLSVHLYMQSLIDYQQSRNNYLKTQIKQAEKKIEEIKELEKDKQRLIERMNIIQQLEESRPQIVHLFDEFVKQVPEGVYFTTMKQKDNKITLEGVAQSNARVSSLMTNIEKSPWLTNPTIGVIETTDKGTRNSYKKDTISKFKLEVTLTAPKKDESS